MDSGRSSAIHSSIQQGDLYGDFLSPPMHILTFVSQFPGGMVDRWKQMAAFIGLSSQKHRFDLQFSRAVFDVLSGTRTPEEVVAKVKTFRSQDASGLMSTVKSEISAKAVPSATSAAATLSAPASASIKSSPSLSAAEAPDAAAASMVSEEDDWTSSEQKALEVQILVYSFRLIC